MRFLQLFRNGYVIALLAGLFCLCACDLDLFDSNFKEIAGGYRLKRVKGSQQFVFCLPRENGGENQKNRNEESKSAEEIPVRAIETLNVKTDATHSIDDAVRVPTRIHSTETDRMAKREQH